MNKELLKTVALSLLLGLIGPVFQKPVVPFVFLTAIICGLVVRWVLINSRSFWYLLPLCGLIALTVVVIQTGKVPFRFIYWGAIVGMGFRFKRFFYLIPLCLLGIQSLGFVFSGGGSAFYMYLVMMLPLSALLFYALVAAGAAIRIGYDKFANRQGA